LAGLAADAERRHDGSAVHLDLSKGVFAATTTMIAEALI
jgi:hypothetical protein